MQHKGPGKQNKRNKAPVVKQTNKTKQKNKTDCSLVVGVRLPLNNHNPIKNNQKPESESKIDSQQGKLNRNRVVLKQCQKKKEKK